MRLFQTKLGENADQCHNGHDPANDIHNEVRFILGGVQRHVHFRWRSTCHHPRRSVVVLTGGLIQSGAFKRAAESKATGAAAVQVVARPAHKRRVPLAHHVVVAAALVLYVRALCHSTLPFLWLVKPGCYNKIVYSLTQFALRVAHHNFHQKVTEQQLSAPHRCSLFISLFTPWRTLISPTSSKETGQSHA